MSARNLDLNAIDVAKPCHEDWSEMTGGDRAKHCGKCEKTVYNLSEMTADEAADLILSRRGDLCVRFYRRADGTMATAECPTGLFVPQRRKLARIAAAAAIVAGSLFAGNAVAGPHSQAVQTTDAADAAAKLREQTVAKEKEEVCEVQPNESTRYTVAKGDTLQSIITRWQSQPEWVKAANPDVDLAKLKPGDKLVVPYYAAARPMIMGVMIAPSAPVQPTPAPTQAQGKGPTDAEIKDEVVRGDHELAE